jgi:hypothetical protein
MTDRNQRALLPAPCRNPFVLGRERGVLGFGGPMGNVDEDLPEPTIACARLAAEGLSHTLVVPGVREQRNKKPV